MRRGCVFMILFALLAIAPLISAQVPTNDEVKAYDEVKNESELFHLILEKKFGEALERLKEVPSEARTMIEILGGSKKQQVVMTGLPLHFAFGIDIPGNLPTSTRQEGMGKDQIDFIMALLKANPLAATQKDKRGRIPLHLAMISPNPTSMDVVLELIAQYPKSPRIRGELGQTPLHMAVSYPMTTFENVYALLQAYPEAVEVQDEFESLPLHAACWGGDFADSQQTIELLVGLNPKHLTMTDDDGETPLMLMAKYGRTSEDAVHFMLEQDPKSVYRYLDEMGGNTPLHHAVASSFEQNNTIYKPFLEHHPDLLKTINRVGQLPLHLALQRCCAQPKMLLDLIGKYPSGASSVDGQGYLPLHHAVNAGVSDVSVVKALLEAWPESIKMETREMNQQGPLPLHFALAHGDREGETYEALTAVIEMLLDQYPEAAKVSDPDSKTWPLHQAFLSRRSASVLKKLMKLTPSKISDEIYISEGSEKKATTILHVFAIQAHGYMKPKDIRDIIELFAHHAPALFKHKDADGKLPLHMVWKQAESIEESRRALVDSLLAKNQDAVHQVDSSNNSVLSYLASMKDFYSFEKVFAMNPFAAAIKSDSDSYPLHELCKEGSSGAAPTEAEMDAMVTALLAQHSAAAAQANQEGDLPLHGLCKSAGASRVETHTIQKLIQAYPEALNTTDRAERLPVQIVGESATDSDDEREHDYWVSFVDLLVDTYPESVRGTRGKSILATVLDKMESLSVHRRREDDHVLKIAKKLYQLYPDAIKERMTKKRTGLHTLMTLLGDMGGMTPTGWSDLTLQVIRDHPELLELKDSHERSPLHVLTLYLGDTAVATRDNQDIRTRDLTDPLEIVYVTLLETYPAAMDEREQYNQTVLELASSQRLRYAKGGRRFYNSPIINMMKKYLRRGSDYWKMKVAIRNAATCGELDEALQSVKATVAAKLEGELKVNATPGAEASYTCDTTTSKLCEACPAQQEMLGIVASYLALYAETMEEKGKDENEISGEYYVNAKGDYVNEQK